MNTQKTNLSQENKGFDYDYLTISAKPAEENDNDIALSTQDLTIPNNTNEALNILYGKNPWTVNTKP